MGNEDEQGEGPVQKAPSRPPWTLLRLAFLTFKAQFCCVYVHRASGKMLLCLKLSVNLILFTGSHSHCGPGWPGTCRDPSASTFSLLELKVCANIPEPGATFFFFNAQYRETACHLRAVWLWTNSVPSPKLLPSLLSLEPLISTL